MSPVIDTLRALARRVRGERPPLPFPETLLLEISHACNLRCSMCPRHFEDVPQGLLSLDMFERWIEPHVGRFKVVNLTGWGETLMNPEVTEIVRRCRAAGCWTCFTTNGLLLGPPLDRAILATGLEQITVSCDAAAAETYEQVRGKNTFGTLIERLTAFTALRREMAVPTVMQWVFVQMRSNFEQLPDAVRLARRCGFDHFVAKHMETAISRENLAEAMWNTGIAPDLTPEITARHDAAIAEAQRIAAEESIRLIIHPRRMARGGMCMAKPASNVFIDSEGRVSNCCYLNVNDVRPHASGGERAADDGVWGDLRRESLPEIIDSARCRAFRRAWHAARVPDVCRGCLQINRMATTSTDPDNIPAWDGQA